MNIVMHLYSLVEVVLWASHTNTYLMYADIISFHSDGTIFVKCVSFGMFIFYIN